MTGTPKPFETLEWESLLESVGLDSDEKRRRFMYLLTIHMLIDRVLTFVLVVKLAPNDNSGVVEQTIRDIAEIPFAKRVKLAEITGAIGRETVDQIRLLNNVRNRLAHFKPKRGWTLEELEKITSEESFSTTGANGIKALQAPMKTL